MASVFNENRREITGDDFDALYRKTGLPVFCGPRDLLLWDEHTCDVYACGEFRDGVIKYYEYEVSYGSK